MNNEIFVSIIGATAVLMTGLITSYLAKRKEIENRINIKKIKLYNKFMRLENLYVVNNCKVNEDDKLCNNNELEYYNLYSLMVLYSNKKVLHWLKKVIEIENGSGDNYTYCYSRLIKEMRKDCGQSGGIGDDIIITIVDIKDPA